jgi:ribokinase
VGAGDAFCAAFALARCSGATLLEATRFASAAGAISVTRRGAAASLPARGEVEALLGKPGITSDTARGGPHAGPV